jgi:putative N6-adenine-specific DNA methylase
MRNFEAQTWEKVRKQALKQQRTPAQCNPPLQIFASDISLNLIAIAQANLERALGEYAQHIQLKQIDALDLKKPANGGVLICNPPYGERMQVQGRQGNESGDPALFFKAFSDMLKQQFSGWRAYILTSDMELPKQMRLKPSKRTPLFNGALECRLFEFQMVAGSNRKEAAQKDGA